MITATRAELPRVTAEQRARIQAAPRTAGAHRDLLRSIPAMNAVQQGGEPRARALPDAFTLAAWNVERCLFPAETAAHLAQLAPDIILLSEVDHGMARTGQRHTTEMIARASGMAYVFGVEFHELDLGGPTERRFCTEDVNSRGWHGNAILSSVPFRRVAMFRLDEEGHWFAADSGAGDPEQPRIGGRMAMAAIVATERGEICAVSTHLESNAGADHRHREFARLLTAIDAFAPGLPVVIGGDLNTGNHMPPNFDWRDETLFALAEERAFSWAFTAKGPTTRPSLITPHPDRTMKLDWICGRDLTCLGKGILPSLDAGGRPLSDHDCVWSRIGPGCG